MSKLGVKYDRLKILLTEFMTDKEVHSLDLQVRIALSQYGEQLGLGNDAQPFIKESSSFILGQVLTAIKFHYGDKEVLQEQNNSFYSYPDLIDEGIFNLEHSLEQAKKHYFFKRKSL